MRAGSPSATLRAFAWIGAVIALLVGSAVLIGGDDRWSGRSLRSSVQLAEFLGMRPSCLWGASLLTCGVVISVGLLVPRPLLRVTGYVAAAIWSAFFGIAFVVTVIRDRHAGTTGLVWLPVAAFFIVMGRRARSLHLNR